MDGVSNILSQLAPGAAVETLFYAVKPTEHVFVAEIAVCNRSAAAASFRVSVSLLGAPTGAKDYLYFDLPITGNDTFAVELGITLGSLDVIRVYASNGNLTFTLMGSPT